MKGYIGRRVGGEQSRLLVISYVGAMLAVAVGTLVAFWLQCLLDPSTVLLMAILVAAWFSGFWPALTAAVVATLSFDYFFTPAALHADARGGPHSSPGGVRVRCVHLRRHQRRPQPRRAIVEAGA